MSLISPKRLAISAISKSAGTSWIVVIGTQRGPAVLESIFNRGDSVCHYVAGELAVHKYEIPLTTRMGMRKSMSRNPNMLWTMIGTGLTLVLVLYYAVYSNTVDTEYYGYTTTNSEVEMDLQEIESGKAEWFVSTESAITWTNLSLYGFLDGMTVRIDASGTDWYY